MDAKYPTYIVDAFTSKAFLGNQAAVCLIDEKLTDEKYQKIASEFNLSETVYPLPLDSADFVKASRFSLRWFTPTNEVPLCGHATLATAHVLFNELGNNNPAITFETLSGPLTVKRSDESKMGMDFPLFEIFSLRDNQSPYEGLFERMEDQEGTLAAVAVADTLVGHNKWLHLAIAPAARKLLIVIDPSTNRETFLKIKHRADELMRAHPSGSFIKGAIVTFAPKDAKLQGFVDGGGLAFDYVSRYFAPWNGIPEDPATGSSQCALAAFWSKALGKSETMKAFQCFPGRGAEFDVTPQPGDRLEILGQAITVLEGKIRL